MCRSNTAAGNPGKSLQQSPWAGSRKWVGFQRGSTPRHSVFAWSTPNVTPRSDCKARPTEPYSRSSPPNPTNTSGPITRAAAHPTSPNLPGDAVSTIGKQVAEFFFQFTNFQWNQVNRVDLLYDNFDGAMPNNSAENAANYLRALNGVDSGVLSPYNSKIIA